MHAGRWERKQLTYQGKPYRLVYAPLPSRNHNDWGVLRKMQYASGSGEQEADRWECTVCSRASLHSDVVSVRI